MFTLGLPLFCFLHSPSLAIAAADGSTILTSQPPLTVEQFPVQTQLAQSTRQPVAYESQQPLYAVEGLAVGTRLLIGSAAYRDYQCGPSDQFVGFTWCTKKRNDHERRGNFEASYSILHAPNGTVVYANRFQVPAYWAPAEVDDDIERYSRKIGAQPSIIQMPSHPGLPKGTLATWGKVAVQPLDRDSLKALGDGKAIKNGLLVDYIGDFSRSAREGLPVYRLGGGAGFVWIASYDESGRGTLRFSAVDASAYSCRHSSSNPSVRKLNLRIRGSPQHLNRTMRKEKSRARIWFPSHMRISRPTRLKTINLSEMRCSRPLRPAPPNTRSTTLSSICRQGRCPA